MVVLPDMNKFIAFLKKVCKEEFSLVWRVLANLALLYVLMEITRLVFLWLNYDAFNLTWDSFWLITYGGFYFDSATIFYVNVLWLLLITLPLHFKERKWVWHAEKWIFVSVNSLALLANLCDSVFFAYRQHRTTATIFSEFGNDGNVGKIIAMEALSHWYLVVLFIAMVWVMWRLYVPVRPDRNSINKGVYYLSRSIGLVLFGVMTVFFIRGCSMSVAIRPISVGFAQRFAKDPMDVDLVLNTPFALIRTINNTPVEVPEFYADEEAMSEIYSPVHSFTPDSLYGALRGHNVVIFALEDFSREFVGWYNREEDGGNYKGYTPFIDSLLDVSVTAQVTVSNSGFSIDAMPALLASTPRMYTPFVVSPYSLNYVTGLGELLGDEGYSSAFFHGADNESLGIHAFVRQIGFKQYFGLNEYLDDPLTGGMKDFDGTWGIWDEPYMQHFRRQLNEMPQPFIAGLFTLSSHHPFELPEDKKAMFEDESVDKVLQTIEYTDYALRKFFEAAKKEPWFDNTLFIFSADHSYMHHTFLKSQDNYLGNTLIPLFFYDPSGILEPQVLPGVMQQIDVMPSLLWLLGYDKDFFAYGSNVFNRQSDDSWAFRWIHYPMIVWGDYLLVMESETWSAKALYNYKSDPQLKDNLIGKGLKEQEQLEAKVKAIVQTFSQTQSANKVHL